MNIPEDEEQRNIIDKLANFVGRNGPKFEELTKSKQKDNPKFAFLFGGEHHPYYKWKVGLESTQFEAQKRLAPPAQQQTPLQTPHHAPQYQHPPPPQHQPPPPQHAQPPEPAAPPKPEFDIDGEFRELLQKLILACTKDNIQNGKGWIVDNSKTEKHLNQVSQFLLHRMLEESLPFQQKLHIVYLINDLLHHARKKEVPLLQSSLAKYVLPIVAVTYNGEASDNQQKLAKVVRIWDTQKFFSIDVLTVLNNCNTLYDSQVDILEKEREVMNKKRKEKEEEKEEEEAKRKKAEQQKQQQEQQQYNQPPQQQPIGQQQQYQQPYNNQQQNFQQFQQFEQWHRPPPPNNPQFYQQQQQQGGFPSHDQQRFPPPQGADGSYNHPPPVWQQPGDQQQGVQTFDYQHQPPVTFDYEHGARPPADQPPSHDPTIPMAPYHDLPAGLMVPLIKIWDCEYNPIESKDLRLPIPQPPSERLLAAIEAFYSPPSHERPRDSQGWEKNGLFEFYKAKLKYIKEKDRKLNVVHRSPSPPSSRSPSPTSEDDDTPLVKERNVPVRRVSPDKRRSRSRSRSRSKSRSKSKSRSRSRSRSRSKGSRSRSRSPRRSPIKRSPTPPEGFAGFGAPSMETKLGAGNVGHQMLTKMGWGGQGLGKKESGIVDPIKGGEIRDKQDKFKGIGSQVNDPFELFRKNRSYSYGSRAASKKKS